MKAQGENAHQVLTTGSEDRMTWVALLDALPSRQRDIHFHPDYLRIYEVTYGDSARLFVWKTPDGVIFQPVLLRAVPGADSWRDLSSVYGYGGPLSTLPESAWTVDIANAYEAAFQDWALQERFVSEFCLLHPFLADEQRRLLPTGLQTSYRKEVVVADLSQPLPMIWSRIEERQRKAALAARKAGIVIEASDNSDSDFDDYHRRYHATMEAVDSTAFWRFPPRYFHNCRDCLGAEHVTLLHARHEGRILASFFHIHMYGTVYYHFSCSDLTTRALNPTSLLMLDSLVWAKSAGFDTFHMGGGRTSGADSLFTFKAAFCGTTLPLYSYGRILDPPTYAALTEVVKMRETRKLGTPKDTDFFPRYRA